MFHIVVWEDYTNLHVKNSLYNYALQNCMNFMDLYNLKRNSTLSRVLFTDDRLYSIET